MDRRLFASSISLGLGLAVAAPAVAAPAPSATAPECSLMDVKADTKTGKIIATFPKAGPDGVSAR